MKKMIRAAALFSVIALFLAGCGEAPTQQSGNDPTTGQTGGGGSQAAAADFKACMVTDQGGVDDRSFNQVSWAGVQKAAEEFGIQTAVLESTSNSDYLPNIRQFASSGECNLIITVGFLLADATKQVAQEYPDQKFAIVDYSYKKPIKNVKPLVFNTAQAAMLAGYLAAGMTETGKVATFGGLPIPTVTIFMDGFAQGVNYYNKKNGTNVELLGWNPKTQKGVFTGDFTDQSKGKTVSQNFIRQGADIIMPVAGPVGLGTAAAAQEADDVSVIWVDTDGCLSAPQYCDLFLTSVMKGLDVAVYNVIKDTINGNFSSDTYVGTLENSGVQIAPYHKFSDDVPDKLKQQVKQLKQAIISGKVEIKSEAKPTPES